jgi:hypothetical protein
MQYRTILVADVPRVQCDEHGVVQVAVPWSDPKSRFTALFEALVINWLEGSGNGLGAFYFHLAELALYPDALNSTHTNA